MSDSCIFANGSCKSAFWLLVLVLLRNAATHHMVISISVTTQRRFQDNLPRLSLRQQLKMRSILLQVTVRNLMINGYEVCILTESVSQIATSHNYFALVKLVFDRFVIQYLNHATYIYFHIQKVYNGSVWSALVVVDALACIMEVCDLAWLW